MKILITGANGMVAKAAIRHCRGRGDTVISLNREELDITNKERVFSTVEAEQPDGILNCAAYTDVDGAEENRDLCERVNASGAENIAMASKAVGSRFLTISTDYVFDGEEEGFYTQRNTPNPISFYGQSKLKGEELVKKAYARSIIVRSGWIFGQGGTNFLSSMASLLRSGKKVKAIADCYGTPTSAEDLAARCRQLVELDLPLTYHVSNTGNPLSFSDFAKLIVGKIGADPSLIEEISSSKLTRPASRPKNSSLRCLLSERLGLDPLPTLDETLISYLWQEKTQARDTPE